MDLQSLIAQLEEVKDEAPLSGYECSQIDRAIYVLKDLEPRSAEMEHNKALAAQSFTEDETAALYYIEVIRPMRTGWWAVTAEDFAVIGITKETAPQVLNSLAAKGIITYQPNTKSRYSRDYSPVYPVVQRIDAVMRLWRKSALTPPAKKQTAANNPLIKLIRSHWHNEAVASNMANMINLGVPMAIVKRYALNLSSVQWDKEFYAALQALEV